MGVGRNRVPLARGPRWGQVGPSTISARRPAYPDERPPRVIAIRLKSASLRHPVSSETVTSVEIVTRLPPPRRPVEQQHIGIPQGAPFGAGGGLRDIPDAVRALGVQIQVFNASTRSEIEAAFASLVRDGEPRWFKSYPQLGVGTSLRMP